MEQKDPCDVYGDADDDFSYGPIRSKNFHDLEYCNRHCRRRFIESWNGNDDHDCDYFEDPSAAVICLRPILPSPCRELSYKPRTGWNYGPSARNTPFLDRLGTGVTDSFGKECNRDKRRERKHDTFDMKKNGKDCNFSMVTPSSKLLSKALTPVSRALSNSVNGNKRIELDSKNQEIKLNKRPRLSSGIDAVTVVTNSSNVDTSPSYTSATLTHRSTIESEKNSKLPTSFAES